MALTEKNMRRRKGAWPKTEDDLIKYIRRLLNGKHDYGTCVYAVSLATLATFRYMASKLGITGFQASCADMDFIRRVRHYKDGFRIVDYNKLLFPQYINDEHFPSHMQLLMENLPHLQRKAKKLLKESPEAHPNVRSRWAFVAKLKRT